MKRFINTDSLFISHKVIASVSLMRIDTLSGFHCSEQTTKTTGNAKA